jgi:hypothetical protein
MNEVRIINKTGHRITVYRQNGMVPELVVDYAPDGPKAEIVTSGRSHLFTVKNIPVYCEQFGEVINLPPEQPGTYYIVALVVAQQIRDNRKDLLVPDYSDRLRIDGRTVGVIGLRQITWAD